ncbi:N-acetylmuramoyl-L-alanine amidase [Candidatus Kinetoplastibacterium crithidii TCC036E]|uniref:N-acetylmuramoyl-L-alanine amidase AmiC n=2 Tax=Candidatus Kinetoplastidibacterium crithidiae TaxID=33056 RepID=M1LUR1_9PROT|nr:N-acetylmuramoyl-L-alanine amidase [Candidatus Kinetoplastibacterium crithidii (ex Angomonas deanei ATCC 30255)]AGF47836.1 N-acetylmuramoyl-L-alanine amidase [Candidatus Kinetoplastibacterium crithidii TCC036E]
MKRQFAILIPLIVLSLLFPKIAFSHHNKALSIRIWPSEEYVRVIIESSEYLNYKSFFLQKPDRLVLDIENIEIDYAITKHIENLTINSSYIKNIRTAKKNSNCFRLVFDLEQPIDSQTFTLKPVASYKYRTILDLYPKITNDPIKAIIYNQKEYKNNKLEETIINLITDNDCYDKKIINNKKIIIVIDPGHGGEDPGAIGINGSMEKNIVLSISKKIEKLLKTQKNIVTYLTRNDDCFVPLAIRTQKARLLKANIFISIHADAWIDPETNGASVFALSNDKSSSIQTKWLADKENRSDLIGGVNLYNQDEKVAKILLDLSTATQINESKKIGNILLKKLAKISKLHNKDVEQAEFAILQIPDIPSILVETAFISNPKEEKLLNSNQHQDKIANAIFKTIIEYFKIECNSN